VTAFRETALGRRVDALYRGDGPAATRFRYAMLAFDATMMGFIVVSSFFHGSDIVERLDYAFGAVVLLDFAARFATARQRWRDLLHPAGLADIIVVLSLLAPLAGENLAFLRAVRALRLLRSYQIERALRRDVEFVRRNRDAVHAGVNLFVFLFVMTAIVFESQIDRNPEVTNFADALYFTVTTLTTTGFGDITLVGTGGRLISIVIMIFGVSLFVRLIQLLLRPARLAWRCTGCGLARHEADAIHCKHCGTLLNIPHDARD
jgi:voltage-gated potassium channel